MRPWIRQLFVCMIAILPIVLFHTGEAKPASDRQVQDPLMRIYFIPFDVYTYVGVSMDDIHETSSYAIWFAKEDRAARVGPHPFIAKLHRTLQSRPATGRKIQDGFIRLRVDIGSQTFFVDINGIVLEKETGKTFILSKALRREIQRDIKYFSGVIDIHASQRVTLPK